MASNVSLGITSPPPYIFRGQNLAIALSIGIQTALRDLDGYKELLKQTYNIVLDKDIFPKIKTDVAKLFNSMQQTLFYAKNGIYTVTNEDLMDILLR